MAIVAPDDAERARTSRRRSNDDVVDDGHVATGGCDIAHAASENVSSIFSPDTKKSGWGWLAARNCHANLLRHYGSSGNQQCEDNQKRACESVMEDFTGGRIPRKTTRPQLRPTVRVFVTHHAS